LINPGFKIGQYINIEKKNKIRKYQSKTTFFYLISKYLFDIQSFVFFEGHILREAKRI
jgi:hypothetical protein